MSEEMGHQMPDLLTTDQLGRTHDLLVGELIALRDQALARRADPAAVSDVFRRRTELLRSESAGTRRAAAGCMAPPDTYRTAERRKGGMPEECEYTVWW
jgi:hypothetical protein